jgi:hypothetical protein
MKRCWFGAPFRLFLFSLGFSYSKLISPERPLPVVFHLAKEILERLILSCIWSNCAKIVPLLCHDCSFGNFGFSSMGL